MSKIKPKANYGEGYIVQANTCDQITGKVITLIETLGLATKQEEALKGLLFQAIESSFYTGNAIYLSAGTYANFRELKEESVRQANEKGVPAPAL